MNKIKVIALSALAFVTIASMVFVGCQKKEELTSTTIPTTVKNTRWKKIFDYLGIRVTVEGAEGYLHETYYANGQLKSRDCDPGNAVCYTKITIGKVVRPANSGDAFVGEMLINSKNDIDLWIKPENASANTLENLNDGILNLKSNFGIGFSRYEKEILIVPAGNYKATIEPDGSYKIKFQF
jgi:hypothetical protein